MTMHGASDGRPKIACSRSACSVFVGRPVDGPPRWMSTMTSGSSTMIASPMNSILSAMPGPDVVVSPIEPANDAPERRADRGDLVFGLERVDAEVLVLRQLVEDVGGRRDRVRAEEQRPSRLLRRGDEAERQRLVARRCSGRSPARDAPAGTS